MYGTLFDEEKVTPLRSKSPKHDDTAFEMDRSPSARKSKALDTVEDTRVLSSSKKKDLALNVNYISRMDYYKALEDKNHYRRKLTELQGRYTNMKEEYEIERKVKDKKAA